MIFPIGDDQVKGGYKPYFSYGLIILNLLVFLIMFFVSPESRHSFLHLFGTIPSHIMQGSGLYTFLTNMFLHGDWMHLIGNMVFLWIFGDNIEATIGSKRFILFYILGGVIASLAHVFSDIDSQVVCIGASGAIAGVLGAYLVMFPKSKIKLIFLLFMNTFKIPAYLFLGIWFLQQIIPGIIDLGKIEDTGGVAWWAHIGGFVFGLLGGYYFKSIYFNSEENNLLNPSPQTPRNNNDYV